VERPQITHTNSLQTEFDGFQKMIGASFFAAANAFCFMLDHGNVCVGWHLGNVKVGLES
jgi:hypothetical protein